MSKVQVQNSDIREGATPKGETPERTIVIEDTGARKVVIEVKEGMIEVATYRYPIYPYGNYIKNTIALYIDDRKLEYYTIRMNWNGTGRNDHGYVQLTDKEVEEIKSRMLSIRSLDDFDILVKTFDDMLSKREVEIDETLDKVIKASQSLIHADETLRNLKLLLKDKNKLRRKLLEWASL